MSNITPLQTTESTRPGHSPKLDAHAGRRITLRLVRPSSDAPPPPGVRMALVRQIRRAIASGDYETDRRVSRAVDALYRRL